MTALVKPAPEKTTAEKPNATQTSGLESPAPAGIDWARRRRGWLTSSRYVLILGVLAVLLLAADWSTVAENFLDPETATRLFPEIVTVALRNTVVYTALAFVVGLLAGVGLALLRLSAVRPYRWLATVYIELFRGLPAMLVLFIVGYGIPIAFPGREIPGGIYGQVALGLGIVSSAYIAETVRAGIKAVPRGQYEAARTLGMSHRRAMASIILPQAFRLVIPPLTNEFVMLTKDSSLVFVLGTTPGLTDELAKFARDGLNTTANATPLIIGGALYLAITVPLSYLARRMEKK